MLAGIMAAIQQSNNKLQESVRADLAANQESVKADLAVNQERVRADLAANQESVRADLAANHGSVKADLAATQESVKLEISNIRKDIQAENEILMRKFEVQIQQTKKEFSAKLDVETRRLTNLVGQVQKETESELVAVRKQLQAVSAECETRIVQANSTTQGLVEELANQFEEHRSEMNGDINKLEQEFGNKMARQKENIDQAIKEKSVFDRKIEQVNAKILALENKVLELPRLAVVTEPRATDQVSGSPSIVNQSAHNGKDNSVQTDENRMSSCQTNSCEVCIASNVNASRMHETSEIPHVSSFLSTSELPLPLFDECTDTNPVFHLRRLDEFIKFKSVPKALQLAVAYRSVTGLMSRQWVETVSWNLKDYDEFKRDFLKTWWSVSRQSLVKCSLYQGKYNRSSNLSLSGYFLKHATMASYLDPRPSDIEIIEAIRYHYPIGVQRAMISNQLKTIEETLHLLKKVEAMEQSEGFQRPHQQTPQQNPNASRQNQHSSPHDRRVQTQNQVRQVEFANRGNRNNGNWRRNRNQGQRSTHLNPNAPVFQGNQEQEQHSEN
jgi:hypothetical protein